MKKIVVLAAVLFGVVAVSCQKKAEIETPVSKVEMRTFTCTIGASESDTKVSIDATGKTTWEDGDEILVHGEYIGTNEGKMYSTIVTLQSTDIINEGKTAIIKVPVDENGIEGIVPYVRSDYSSTLYAAYPASAVKGGNYRTYYYSVFKQFTEPLMAAYDKDGEFVFYNTGSIISFTIPGSEAFTSYLLEGNGGSEVIGYDQFSVRVGWQSEDDKERRNIPYESSSSIYGTLGAKTSITGSVVCDGSTVNRIFIPGGVNFESGFTLYFYEGGYITKYVKTSKTVDLRFNSKKGQCLALGTIPSEKMNPYTPPTTHTSSIPTAGATALDADENANCYIVDGSDDGNANKVFTFKAYKGNSTAGVGTVASAEILWETWNNAETVTKNSVVAAVDFEKKAETAYYTMVFKTPETIHTGNALIAAKDAGGNILWSWHIWIPKTEITIVDDANYSVKKSMSRNLGALEDAVSGTMATVESFGLLYEWGRKDPFPGLGVLSGAGAITVAGTVSSQEGPMSVEDAIKNPTVYVYKSKGDWAADGTDTASLWGETNKALYDPCPVGYMLPARNKSCAFWSGTKWTASTDPFVLDADNCIFSVGSQVFPLAGYMDDAGEGQKKAGTRTIVWSGRWDSGTVNGYGFYGYTDDGIAFRNQGNVRARGGYVRCVAE